MIVIRVLLGKLLQCIDSAQSYRQNFVAQHLRPTLVAVIQ